MKHKEKIVTSERPEIGFNGQKPVIFKANSIPLPFKVSIGLANLFPGVISFKKK